jgi:hypothetical protein
MKIPLVVEWVVEHVSMSDYESLILLLTVGNIADSTSSRPGARAERQGQPAGSSPWPVAPAGNESGSH